MAERKRTKGQTTIYKTLRRKQLEQNWKLEWTIYSFVYGL